MRGRSSSRQEIKEGMKIDKVGKLKEEPQLSGAYIRSLVKQLTSSRAKNPTDPKQPDSVDGNGCNDQNSAKFSEGIIETPQTDRQAPPQQHKKQLRRRLHTSRPYQERLLNMAEARREIVTALKFHRAAMKQADEQRQKQQQQQQGMQQKQQSLSLHVSSPCFEQEARMKSRTHARIYPSSTNNFSYLDSFSYSSFSHPRHPQNPFSWPVSPVFPSAAENLNFPLPNQTLGLNLNFHDFNNIDTTLYHSSNTPSIYSSSSLSSSSSPTLSVVTEEVPPAAISYEAGPFSMAEAAESYGGGGLHQAMDDEEMAEIRSIGEQHQIEWNDTVNLMTSAWWFKFLNTMELGPEVKVEDDGYTSFDQVMEFPDWMNASETCFQQHFDDYCSDPALPCMEIGEIGGMDGEWLA